MIVFVHGVPETHALWDKLRSRLDEPSIALALPGFGNPRPHGFSATKDAYFHWICDVLLEIDDPIDLVGHDWGAAFALRLATTDAVPLRSWAADVTYLFHPDYVWHDLAQTWQQDGPGEAFWTSYLAASPTDIAPVFESYGLEHADAVSLAAMADATMGACVLDLYRSATPNPFADWSPRQWATQAPGLALIAPGDPFGDEAMSIDVANRLHARIATLPACGHWWPLQDPDAAVATLQAFWKETRS